MRYVGQAHEVEVEIPSRGYTADDGATLRTLFEAEYRRLFNRLVPGVDVEAMSWKVEVSTEVPAPERRTPSGTNAGATPHETRPLFEPSRGVFVDAPIYRREKVAPGTRLAGPAVIEEDETSTVVTGAFDATVQDWAIILTRREGDAR